jgi:hypothetical protein
VGQSSDQHVGHRSSTNAKRPSKLARPSDLRPSAQNRAESREAIAELAREPRARRRALARYRMPCLDP